MTDKISPDDFPDGYRAGKYIRGGLQVVAGAVPFAGGLLSAIGSAWSESEQEKVNRFHCCPAILLGAPDKE